MAPSVAARIADPLSLCHFPRVGEPLFTLGPWPSKVPLHCFWGVLACLLHIAGGREGGQDRKKRKPVEEEPSACAARWRWTIPWPPEGKRPAGAARVRVLLDHAKRRSRPSSQLVLAPRRPSPAIWRALPVKRRHTCGQHPVRSKQAKSENPQKEPCTRPHIAGVVTVSPGWHGNCAGARGPQLP